MRQPFKEPHPVQGVYDAIARSWAKAESKGHYPVSEIDLIGAMRADPHMIAMACEVAEARGILNEGRVHWLWRWLALALFLALIAETLFLLTR
jgi:hypothetical protein